jgi:hypothetical protein
MPLFRAEGVLTTEAQAVPAIQILEVQANQINPTLIYLVPGQGHFINPS